MSAPARSTAPAAYRAEESWALEQDARDPLAWCRGEFELPPGPDGRPLVYLCGNSLGLMPRAAPDLVAAELNDWARLGVEAHLEGVSFYRPAGARRKILVEEGAFPSDRYALASHLRSRGQDPGEALLIAAPRPGEVTLRTDDLEALLAERGSEIAVVLLPGVQYYTGQLLDLERITRAARRAGCAVGFDLAHAVGNAVLRLHQWDADFAVWCSYKYLNGGPGAVGGAFVNARHARSAALPRYAGWWGNDPATRFAMDRNPEFIPVDGADGWQVSNPPILSMAPLRASLDLFDRAGIAALRAKSERLTGYLEHLVRRAGGELAEIITPQEPAARGCQLSLRIPGRGGAISEGLRVRGVVGDLREPDVIRLAPAPLYNTFHEVWRAAGALSELLQQR